MLQIVNNKLDKKSPNGSHIPAMVDAIIVKEIQRLGNTPCLTGKDLINLERMLRMHLDMKRDSREDYRTYLLKNGLNGVDLNDPAVKRVMDLMETLQIGDGNDE